MFHKCSDKCLCASSQPGGKETVLYCYGEVVIERPSLRPGQGAATKETDEDVVLLYIAQLAALAVLLTAILLVLISIRRGLVKLKREVTRLLSLISGRDVECDSECGSSGDTRHGGGGQAHHQDQPQHRTGAEMIKSGSVSEWIKYQPRSGHGVVGRSPSSLLNNHKMTEQDRVEETALLNNTYTHS